MTSPALFVVSITLVSAAFVRSMNDRRVIRSNRTPGHDAWLRVDREKAMIDSIRLSWMQVEPPGR